ncbi:MAG: hypothetical protein ABIH89_01540 [Elusimicrobiota bacterium]
MNKDIIKGILTVEGDRRFLKGDDGARLLEDELIWNGYLEHWTGRRLCARRLDECDYDTGRPIVIMWPDVPLPEYPFVEIYYNERLVKYPFSFMGHIAINVNGEIFNFSHLLIENEVMSPAEYFYRPALGEFAPHPDTMLFNIDDKEKPYYNKFGRQFMRTIHVLHIKGLDTVRLSDIYHNELKVIHSTPVNPKRPEKYRSTNVFTRNCATIIRDGLRKCGFPGISGIFPRDLFISAASSFLEAGKKGAVKAGMLRLRQLKVPEALYSVQTFVLNPMNLIRMKKLPKEYCTDIRTYWAECYSDKDEKK